MSIYKWEAVIGLEIHVQLNTRSKLFSMAPNRFGDEPNTNISAVCTGQPGSLPVLNKDAVRKAVQFGCAVGAEISPVSEFDRKSYFYPDSPRNFQITQFYAPILRGGCITAQVGKEKKTFLINRAHLEDDSGMLKHFRHFAGVDDNRAGVPLLEIVSEPCIRSPQEASAYASAIKAIMEYLDASDCNMEEGSLRVDGNISVRQRGETGLRSKAEIKNMNSFYNMELALASEIDRQIELYEKDPHARLIQGTYRFDAKTGRTVLMREKEGAEDYRYFPEPDLPPIVLAPQYIDDIRRSLPELPTQRFERYTSSLGLSEYASHVLINDKALSDYFEQACIHCSNPRALCNWVTVEFIGRLKPQGKAIGCSGVRPEHIARLVDMIEQGLLTGKMAKLVADDMVAHPGKSPEEIVEEHPHYRPLSDPVSIESMIDTTLATYPQAVQDVKAGKTKAFAFLVGQVMQLCQGQADSSIVNAILTKKLK